MQIPAFYEGLSPGINEVQQEVIIQLKHEELKN